MTRIPARTFAAALVAALAGCSQQPTSLTRAGLEKIDHIIVIYAENRSFDNLYGLFPGANGIANAMPAQYTQIDNDGKPTLHSRAIFPTSRFESMRHPSICHFPWQRAI